ncbi:GGDEF domain-containing protein [Tundrisphaera lichenicola]|uniref:GGDEF domain-containing protein n=1 Tax=Tundrisphaera lichenicola TaxID=2029860 RepID=UPI003EBC331E
MLSPPPSLEGFRRVIEREPMKGVWPILGIGSTYLAAHYLGAGASAFVSGFWTLIIGLSWSRWAIRLDQAIYYFSQQSWTDDLTGLGNDRIFRDRLELASRDEDPDPVSLILIDLDQFKFYNDTHGHPAGDEALKAFGSILRSQPDVAALSHRLGGDEFAILIDTDSVKARSIAEALRSGVEQYLWPLSPITASFGIASVAGPDRTRIDLRSLADRELYRSKARGGNCVSDSSVDGPPGS